MRRYTLEERKDIYSRPLEKQFVPVFKCGEAIVLRHLIRSDASEDYDRVFDVAQALAFEKWGPVYILPEINAHARLISLSLRNLDQYTKWVLDSQGYHYNEAYFYMHGVLYKRTRD